MPVSASEAYLHSLAERTFLKLWSVPNAHRAPGKELSDLVVVFGDDIIIFSDKACEFGMKSDRATGWKRWRREAIDSSVKQLAGALRRMSSAQTTVLLDAKGKFPLPFPLPVAERRRLHLIAIARPSHDPSALPPGWQPLTCVGTTDDNPFEIEPIRIGSKTVHVFDGEAIDLLLEQLDTAPDFIAYLTGRAEALDTTQPYCFREEDLLAASIEDWAAGTGLTPHVPPLDTVTANLWSCYERSARAERSAALNRRSRTIDNLIEHFHRTFEAGAFLNDNVPEILEHENVLRLLAAESRFARRMIITALFDIREEEDQSVPWAATVASPRDERLRYLWMIYPDLPGDVDADHAVRIIGDQLQHQTLVTAGEFTADRIVSIALPNGRGTENIVAIRLFDSSNWTEHDYLQARLLKAERLFGEPMRIDFLHLP